MDPLFPASGISALMIKPGTNTFLYGFHHFLVFHFNSVQLGAGAFIE